MIKDWKKTYDKNKTIIWKNMKIGETISIGHYFANSSYVGGSWRMFPFGKKEFKNKSQAIKFARSYMRKH